MSSSSSSASLSSPPVESDVEKEMKKRCTSLDATNSGSLTIAQLQSVMQVMGEDLSEADVKDMVDEAGCRRADGSVDYQQFISAFHAAVADDEL